MARSPDRLSFVERKLAGLGLVSYGAFVFDQNRIGLLIGNAGPDMWHVFSRSDEFSDGKPDPMNRWTVRVVSGLAEQFTCETVFPFDHPFPPFQQFARQACGVKSSPLGIVVHPVYGLWHAYRAVLVFDPDNGLYPELEVLIQDVEKTNHVCDECVEKPCLSACPVSAFSDRGLNVAVCFEHLDSSAEPDCMALGCAARNACPVGQEHRYHPDQLKFHMRSYRGK